jgi:hypothetical protein
MLNCGMPLGLIRSVSGGAGENRLQFVGERLRPDLLQFLDHDERFFVQEIIEGTGQIGGRDVDHQMPERANHRLKPRAFADALGPAH